MSANFLRSPYVVLIPLLSLLSITPKSTSKPTYVYGICINTTASGAPNTSKYQTNLKTVLESLSSNATNPNGFYATSAGTETPETAVYGLFLCRGDLNSTACQDCVATATTDLPQTYCPDGFKAVIWYDECMVRYTNHSLSSKLVILYPELSLYSNQNNTATQTWFPGLLQKSIVNVVNRAAKENSGKKFATSKVNITGSHSLYTLAQCTPDLNTSDCSLCLKAAMKALPLSDGGRVLQPSCNIRYEIYPFFNSLSTTSAPSPAPVPVSASVTTTSSTPTGPVPSASAKMIIFPRLKVIVGFGLIAIINLCT